MPSRRAFLMTGLSTLAVLGRLRSAAAQSTGQLTAARVLEVPAALGQEPVVMSCVATSADGQFLATGGDDYLVRIWRLSSGQVIQSLRGHTDWVRGVAWHPSAPHVASVGDDRSLRIWNPTTNDELHAIDLPQPLFALGYTPDGHALIVAGFDDVIRVFDAASYQLIRELNAASSDVRALAISPDGTRLAVGSRGGRIRLWSLPEFTVVADIDAHRQRIRAVSFSPDGQQLASGGEDRQLRLWASANGTAIVSLPDRPGKIMSLAWVGPDWLAAGASDNTIRLWQRSQRAELLQLTGHTGSVTSLVWSPAQQTLISGSFDTSVRLWNLDRDGMLKLARQPEQIR